MASFGTDRAIQHGPSVLGCSPRLPSPALSQIILSPLELIGRIAALLPPPRPHRHRSDGVLAPNSPLRPAVTALAPEAVVPAPASNPAVDSAAETPPRDDPALSRPLPLGQAARAHRRGVSHDVPSVCGAEMPIIAFITEAMPVRAILESIGEPAKPPRIAQARGPPQWYEDATDNAIDAAACAAGDPDARWTMTLVGIPYRPIT